MNDGPDGLVSFKQADPSSDRWLRRLSVTMLALLLAQFLLGMLLNFFFTAPDQHPGANASSYFSGVAQVV